MKNTTFTLSLLALLVCTMIPFATAYPFLDYGHDTFFNDTAEIGTPTSYGWANPSSLSYATNNFFNGSKSILFQFAGALPKYTTITFPTNFNLTFAVYINTTDYTAGNFELGLGDGSDSRCLSDGTGVGIQILSSDDNWHTCAEGVTVTGPDITVGWHIAEIRKVGTSYTFFVDGTQIGGTGTSPESIGAVRIYVFGFIEGIYVDDMHAWNGTVTPPPPPPSPLFFTVQPTTSGITNTSAVTSSTTNNLSNLTVNYGTTLSFGTQYTNVSYASSFSVNLTGLTHNTTYFVQHIRCSVESQCNTSTTVNFTTNTNGAPPPPPPPVVEDDNTDVNRGIQYALTILIILFLLFGLVNAVRNGELKKKLEEYTPYFIGLLIILICLALLL